MIALKKERIFNWKGLKTFKFINYLILQTMSGSL